MANAKWTATAREDLKQIGCYIGRTEGRPSFAAAILREIKAKSDEYSAAFARGSVLGSDASVLGDGCRVFSHKRWIVVFEAIESGIEILRVFDGSRDYPRLFGQ
jgi:plasmid stabilization system protein ParE